MIIACYFLLLIINNENVVSSSAVSQDLTSLVKFLEGSIAMQIVNILGEISIGGDLKEISDLENCLKQYKDEEVRQACILNSYCLYDELLKAEIFPVQIEVIEKQQDSFKQIIDTNKQIDQMLIDKIEALRKEKEQLLKEKEPVSFSTTVKEKQAFLDSKLKMCDIQIQELTADIKKCNSNINHLNNELYDFVEEKDILENRLAQRKKGLQEIQDEQEERYNDQEETLTQFMTNRKNLRDSMIQSAKAEVAISLQNELEEIRERLALSEKEQQEINNSLTVTKDHYQLLKNIKSGEVTIDKDQQLFIDKAGGIDHLLTEYKAKIAGYSAEIQQWEDKINDLTIQVREKSAKLNDNNYEFDQEFDKQLARKNQELEKTIAKHFEDIEEVNAEYENEVLKQNKVIERIKNDLAQVKVNIDRHEGKIKILSKNLEALEKEKDEFCKEKKILQRQKENEELIWNSSLETNEELITDLEKRIKELENKLITVEEILQKQDMIVVKLNSLLGKIYLLVNFQEQEEGFESEEEEDLSFTATSLADEKIVEGNNEFLKATILHPKESVERQDLLQKIMSMDDGFMSEGGEDNPPIREDILSSEKEASKTPDTMDNAITIKVPAREKISISNLENRPVVKFIIGKEFEKDTQRRARTSEPLNVADNLNPEPLHKLSDLYGVAKTTNIESPAADLGNKSDEQGDTLLLTKEPVENFIKKIKKSDVPIITKGNDVHNTTIIPNKTSFNIYPKKELANSSAQQTALPLKSLISPSSLAELRQISPLQEHNNAAPFASKSPQITPSGNNTTTIYHNTGKIGTDTKLEARYINNLEVKNGGHLLSKEYPTANIQKKPKDIPTSQNQISKLDFKQESEIDFLPNSKKPWGFLGKGKSSRDAYLNVHEGASGQVLSTKSPIRTNYAGSLMVHDLSPVMSVKNYENQAIKHEVGPIFLDSFNHGSTTVETLFMKIPFVFIKGDKNWGIERIRKRKLKNIILTGRYPITYGNL